MGNALGHPTVQFTVDVQNTGGRTVQFTDIDCFLKKSTGEVINLPIENYLQGTPTSESANPTRLPITSISLRPGERWNASVTGHEEWNETDEATVNSISFAIIDDIQAQRAKAKAAEATWYAATDDHVKQAMAFFKEHFKITQGQYTAFVAVKHDEQTLAVAAHPLVIYSYHIDYLRSLSDGYKWGYNLLPSFASMRPDLRLQLNRPLSIADAARGYASK